MKLSIVTCSHSAPESWLATLQSLAEQKASDLDFEVLAVNNGFGADRERELSASPPVRALGEKFRLLREDTPGLAFARVKAFRAATGDWLALLDHDNMVEADFVAELGAVVKDDARLGGIVAMITPEWEASPPAWLNEFGVRCLSYTCPTGKTEDFACRRIKADAVAHEPSPPGGGMIVRADVVRRYLESPSLSERLSCGRSGTTLFGCEDNDLWGEISHLGLETAVSNRVKLRHQIPAERMRTGYLVRLNFSMSYSFGVMHAMNGQGRAPESWYRQASGAFRHLGKARRTKQPMVELLWWVKTLGYNLGLRHARRSRLLSGKGK